MWAISKNSWTRRPASPAPIAATSVLSRYLRNVRSFKVSGEPNEASRGNAPARSKLLPYRLVIVRPDVAVRRVGDDVLDRIPHLARFKQRRVDAVLAFERLRRERGPGSIRVADETLRPLLDHLARFLERGEFGGLDVTAAAANRAAASARFIKLDIIKTREGKEAGDGRIPHRPSNHAEIATSTRTIRCRNQEHRISIMRTGRPDWLPLGGRQSRIELHCLRNRALAGQQRIGAT